jgi:hypothetical protein
MAGNVTQTMCQLLLNNKSNILFILIRKSVKIIQFFQLIDKCLDYFRLLFE